jgi:predicted transposase YbfD/YdcC
MKVRWIFKRMTKILKRINDPRQQWKVWHSLVEILMIRIIGITAGADSSYKIHLFAINREEWLRKYLTLEHGIPGRLTIERVLAVIDPKAMEQAFISIMRMVRKASKGAVVAIDGKAFFSNRNEDGSVNVFYMVEAWCTANGIALGQVQVKEKSNEITAIPELLKYLGIKGATVTIDAIGCQKNIVKQIIKGNKANYVIALKENQPTMYNEFREYARDCIADPLLSSQYSTLTTLEKGHGRIEKREYYLFTDIAWFADKKEWVGLAGLAMVRSTRQVGKKEPSSETRYYITSLTKIEGVAEAIRSHWSIENNLHWVLDTAYNEDGAATKKAATAANLAHLRRFTANLLRSNPSSLSIPSKRYQCALNTGFLEQIIFNSPLFS